MISDAELYQLNLNHVPVGPRATSVKAFITTFAVTLPFNSIIVSSSGSGKTYGFGFGTKVNDVASIPMGGAKVVVDVVSEIVVVGAIVVVDVGAIVVVDVGAIVVVVVDVVAGNVVVGSARTVK